MALFLQRVQTVGSSLISAIVKYLKLSAQHLKYSQLYSGHCRELELASSLATVRNTFNSRLADTRLRQTLR